MFSITKKTDLLLNPVLLISFGRLATAIIAIFNLRVMTSLLAPSEYGMWAVLLSFQTFATLFLINPVDQHVYINTHKWSDEGTLKPYLRQYNFYITAVSITVSIASFCWFIFGSLPIHNYSLEIIVTSLAIGFFVFVSTWNANLTFMLNMLGCRQQSVKWTIITASLGTLISASLTYNYPHASSWLLGQTLALAFGALGAWHDYNKEPSTTKFIDKSSLKFSDFLSKNVIVIFCIPLATATGFMWVQTSGYRLIISDVWGVAQLGILAVGLGIAAQLTGIVESLATQLIYPYFVRRITNAPSDDVNSAITDLMNVLGPVYALWAGFNALCTKSFLTLLTDEKYHTAAPYLIIGVVIELLRSNTNLWTNTARALLKTNQLILPYAAGALVIITASIYSAHLELDLMLYSFILIAAAFTTFLMMVISMQRLCKISVDKTRLSISILITATSFYLELFVFSSPTSLTGKLLFIMTVGLFFCLITFVILWKSPSLERLLDAKLQSEL